MNEKITYRHNDDTETDYIIVAPPFDLGDWLDNASVHSEQDGDVWYILDESGERTGETYTVISREPTDEELVG